MLDGIARAYQQALLLANRLRSDLLDSTMHDSRGDLIPASTDALSTGAMTPASTFSSIQYPAGPGPQLLHRCCVPQSYYLLAVEANKIVE